MTDDEIIRKYLEKFKGYTPDFYLCVYQKVQETDMETAVAICEAMYG